MRLSPNMSATLPSDLFKSHGFALTGRSSKLLQIVASPVPGSGGQKAFLVRCATGPLSWFPLLLVTRRCYCSAFFRTVTPSRSALLTVATPPLRIANGCLLQFTHGTRARRSRPACRLKLLRLGDLAVSSVAPKGYVRACR